MPLERLRYLALQCTLQTNDLAGLITGLSEWTHITLYEYMTDNVLRVSALC